MSSLLPADKERSLPSAKALSDRMFIRLLGLVRSRLFAQIRSDKDVLVVDSVLSSFFAHHAVEEIDLTDEESLWCILSRIALRHCNKHNKRAQRSPHPPTLSISAAADSSDAGFEPADDEPSAEAQVEFIEFLGRFQAKLSSRERQVLELALAQEAQGAMARKLQVSQTTICNDLKHLRAKLQAELNQT